MTLKNNRAPLLCYVKIVASFQTIGELKLELRFRNAQLGSKSEIFSRLKFHGCPSKNYRTPLLCYVKFMHFFSYPSVKIKTRVTARKRPNLGIICFDVCKLDLWPKILTFSKDITFVSGNNERNIMKKVVTDGRTNRRTVGKKCS